MDYKSFQERLSLDAAFAAKFVDCRDVANLIETAAKEGYSFTEEDIRKNTGLSLDELASVAGGVEMDSEEMAEYIRRFVEKPKEVNDVEKVPPTAIVAPYIEPTE